MLRAEGEDIAVVGEIHPEVAEAYELNGRVYIAEINLPKLFRAAKQMGYVKGLARFPAVSRDLALVVRDSQPVGPMMEAMREAGGKLLEDIQMFDVFRGPQVGLERKSVAFSLRLRAEDHTLTDEEIVRVMNKVIRTVAEKFGAEIRA